MSELEFINTIKRRQRAMPEGCLGIGDDAAIIEPGSNGGWVIATDMLVDGRHFASDLHQFEDIGRKALAVNLSDMAAMGALPRYALVSLAIPLSFGQDKAEQVWAGLQRLADEFEVTVIGGDTNAWEEGLVINVTVLGVPHPSGSVLRSGARPGDHLYVTGALGGSMEEDKHLRFSPRVKEAQQLLACARPTAMIDISDGLATDLRHLCESSGVGADLDVKAIPISDKIPVNLGQNKRLQRALTDGEDFELLFTLPPAKSQLLAALPFRCHKIGVIKSDRNILLDGEPLTVAGFEHLF